MSKNKTFLIMAGGTGGHVFPALATARMLQANDVHVHWLGSDGGMETELVSSAGIPISCISISGLRGKGKLALLTAPFRLFKALIQAMAVIRAVKPDGVLGMGGFVTGPGGLAARLLGKPLLIHEQNAVAGTTNRLLAAVATRVLTAFPDVLKNGTAVGNPVRQAIFAASTTSAANEANGDKADRDECSPCTLKLLVLGGSLGARAINELLPEALSKLDVKSRPEVRHQTGKAHFESTQAQYNSLAVDAQIEAFVDDMAAAYAWADLVVCRSGALTVSELAAAGVAFILVPYPHAIDDHQTANARWLVEQGAAVLCPQPSLNIETLLEHINSLGGDRARLTSMAEQARLLAMPDAANQVATISMEIVND